MKKVFLILVISLQFTLLSAQTSLETRSINNTQIIIPTFKNLLSLAVAKSDVLKNMMKNNEYQNLNTQKDSVFYPKSNDKSIKLNLSYSITKDKANNLLIMTFQENGPKLISEFRTEIKNKYPSAKTQINGANEQYVVNLDGKFDVIFFVKDMSKMVKSSTAASVAIMF